jgi:hypothetical protein
MTIRTRQLVAGAFAAAAVATPLYAALTTDPTPELNAQPQCLAWFGNIEDGKCLSYSNGNGITAGTPGYYGGNSPDSGFSTGPLLPSQTWTWGSGP